MNEVLNPYDHLTESQLRRQLSKLTRKLARAALKERPVENFEYQRILILTISDSLARKSEIKLLESWNSQEGTTEVKRPDQQGVDKA